MGQNQRGLISCFGRKTSRWSFVKPQKPMSIKLFQPLLGFEVMSYSGCVFIIHFRNYSKKNSLFILKILKKNIFYFLVHYKMFLAKYCDINFQVFKIFYFRNYKPLAYQFFCMFLALLNCWLRRLFAYIFAILIR